MFELIDDVDAMGWRRFASIAAGTVSFIFNDGLATGVGVVSGVGVDGGHTRPEEGDWPDAATAAYLMLSSAIDIGPVMGGSWTGDGAGAAAL